MVSTVTQQGQMARVQNAIAVAARQTGVDFGYLIQQARVESSLNPDARARSSSATGLYQFIEQSWLATVDKHGAAHGLGWAADAIERGADGRYRIADPALRSAVLDLRRSPEASAAMAAEFASDNRATLERRLGHGVESVDLYLAHFLGAGGATRFLKAYDADPNASAASLFPAGARANRSVFFDKAGNARSLGDIRARFAAKFDGAPIGPRTGNDMRFAGGAMAKTAPANAGVANARLAYLMLASLGIAA